MILSNKTAIITGAARGIGQAIAMRYVSEGANVCIADLDIELAKTVSQSINDEKGEKTIAFEMDATNRESVCKCIEETVGRFGKLDIMVNNAGMNVPMHFMDVTEANFDQIIKVNTWSAFMCTQEAAKQMIKQGKGGKIICAASIASRQTQSEYTPYCIAKSGVVSIVQAAARALSPNYGINVTAYAPGVVETPLWNQLDKDLMAIGVSKKPGEAIKSNIPNILMRKLGTPEEVAGAALYLASPDSDYMTGQVLMIDGGIELV